MKDRSSLNLAEFIAVGVVEMIFLMKVYRNLLFRSLSVVTYTKSIVLLCVFLIISLLLGGVVTLRYNKSIWTVNVMLSIGFGAYTVLAYGGIIKTRIRIVLTLSTLLAVVCILIILSQKINSRKKWKLIIKRRLFRCLYVTQNLIAAGMLVIMLSLGLQRTFDIGIVSSSVKATTLNDVQEHTIENNIDKVLLLQESEWNKLDVEEKINVMQTIANIEAASLGISDELTVRGEELEENVAGKYSDAMRLILIDVDHLKNDSGFQVLETLCHEVYHCYQYRLIDAYNGADEKAKRLLIYKKAETYSWEEVNYVDASVDVAAYYAQSLEIDANEYAKEEVYIYYFWVCDYKSKLAQEQQSEQAQE